MTVRSNLSITGWYTIWNQKKCRLKNCRNSLTHYRPGLKTALAIIFIKVLEYRSADINHQVPNGTCDSTKNEETRGFVFVVEKK